MAITAAMVKELRDSTGAGMMDAKKALTETDGDMAAAIDWLRTKGLSKAAKKSGRTAAEGLVAVKVKGGTGVAVEVNSETVSPVSRSRARRRPGRTGVETSDTKGVLDGDLDAFMAATLAQNVSGKSRAEAQGDD